jgi:radical SAM superfamily enzyme YgiQ (UPF0313 family)
MKHIPLTLLYCPTINPLPATDLRFFVPYAINYIVDIVCEQGYSVEFHDLNHTLWFHRKPASSKTKMPFTRRIGPTSPAAMARSLLDSAPSNDPRIWLLGKDFFSFQVDDESLVLFRAICTEIKKRLPQSLIIVGGSHCKRQFAEGLIRICPSIDYVFYNEIWSRPNYDDLLLLLECLEASPNGITYYPPIECFMRAHDGTPVDLSDAPQTVFKGNPPTVFPSYGLLHDKYSIHLSDLIGREFGARRDASIFRTDVTTPGIVTVKFTHGCVNRCAYCKGGMMPARLVSVKEVVDYIELLVKEKGFTNFFFLNRELNMNVAYFRDFCRELINRKLSVQWSDSLEFSKLTEGDIAQLRDAGCIQVCVGVDTTSQSLGRKYGRYVDRDFMSRILRSLHKNGIWTRVNTIVGFPHQTDMEISEDYDFFVDHACYIDHLNVSEFKLFPKTYLGEYPEQYGLQVHSQNVTLSEQLRRDNPNRDYFSLSFDVIGGRGWEELREFAKTSSEKVASARDEGFDAFSARIPLVFLLYSAFGGEKDQVISAIKQHIYRDYHATE